MKHNNTHSFQIMNIIVMFVVYIYIVSKTLEINVFNNSCQKHWKSLKKTI
jgi:hypothetical protein